MSKCVKALTLLVVLATAADALAAWPAHLSVCIVMRGAEPDAQAVVVGANDQAVLCLTASHAAPTVGQKVPIRWASGKTDIGTVIKTDPAKDLSAFTVPNRGDRLPFIIGDAATDQRSISGARLELTGRFTGFQGRFAARDGGGFWMTGRNEPGDSGGPVFDAKANRLVGLMIGRQKDGSDGTLAVSGSVMREFVGEFVGGLVSLEGVELTSQCGRFSQRLAPNRFAFASNRINANNNVNNATLELAFQLDTLLAQVQLQDQLVQQLQQQIANAQPGANGKDGRDGVDGKDGVNGADGKDGADGQDAAVDYQGTVYPWIKKWIEDHKAELFPQPTLPQPTQPTSPSQPPGEKADAAPAYYDVRPHKK